MKRMMTLLAAFGCVALAANSVSAQDYGYDDTIGEDGIEPVEDPEIADYEDPAGAPYDEDSYEEPAFTPQNEPEFDDSEPALVTPIGMGLSLGGGVTDYVGEADDFTSPGGNWEARYILGTRTVIGGELAYLGTANGLNTLGVEDNAVLMSNGGEGALRVNFLTDELQPYVLGGIGWKHFNVVNMDVNTSDIRDSDDAMTVPLGVGFAYRYSNVFADLRGMYRPAFLADITTSGGEDDTNLDTLTGSLNLGFEF